MLTLIGKFWKTHPEMSFAEISVGRVVSQTDFWKTHPNMDSGNSHGWVFQKSAWPMIPRIEISGKYWMSFPGLIQIIFTKNTYFVQVFVKFFHCQKIQKGARDGAFGKYDKANHRFYNWNSYDIEIDMIWGDSMFLTFDVPILASYQGLCDIDKV